jgi:hypothetical protein
MDNRVSITHWLQCENIVNATILTALSIFSLAGFTRIDEINDQLVENTYYIFTCCQVIYALFPVIIVITQHKYVGSDINHTFDDYIKNTFGNRFGYYIIMYVSRACTIISDVISIFSFIMFLLIDNRFHTAGWIIYANMCAPTLITLIVLAFALPVFAIKKCGTCLFGRYVWNNTRFKHLMCDEKRHATREDTQEPCSICWSQIIAGEQVRALQCQHTYHPACIDQWLAQSSTCPLCKDVVQEVIM